MNGFDRVVLDIPQLLAQQGCDDPAERAKRSQPPARGGFSQTVRTGLVGLLTGARLYPQLVHSNLNLRWLDEFNRYWVGELGNRTLGPHEFHWLSSHYRSQFQDLSVSDSGSGSDHMQAWQDARAVYLLFYYHYKLSLHPLAAWSQRRYIPRGGSVCEYGCGAAPIGTSLVQWFPGWQVQVTCADIPHILLHYTRWKLGNEPSARIVAIDPDGDTPLDGSYDTIFCQRVLEHVPRPLAVIEHLHDRLKPGGHLIFDFIRSDGAGLDAAGGLRDRQAALARAAELFTVVEGQLHIDDRSQSTLVVRKAAAG